MEIVRRRKVAVTHRLPRRYPTRRSSEKEASTPVTQLMKYGVPPLLALLTFHNQSKPEALFGENAAPLWCFVAATATYWLVVGAMKQMKSVGRKWFQLLWRAAFASGILSAISLVSMFLSYPVSMLPLLIWLPLALLLACPKLYAWLSRQTTTIIQALAVRARGQPPNLPL